MNDSTTPLWLQVPEPSDLVKAFGSAVDVPAFGGRLEVNWAPGARVTSAGGLAYFATFQTTGAKKGATVEYDDANGWLVLRQDVGTVIVFR